MDELFYLLLFLFFILAPLIEGIRKRRSRPPPPPSEPAPESWEVEGDAVPRREPAGARGPRAAERAEDVIPDDLWEILTGERRRPAPVEEEPEFEAGWEPEPEPWEREPEYIEEEPPPRVREPKPEPPPEPSPAERLAALRPEPERRTRARVSAPLEVAGAVRRPEPVRLGLDSVEELRRAVILREVLGPPKGLE